MITLTIQHNIHLTRDQRYRLHSGEKIETVGVSLPVWIMDAKTTSEPAKEVFCKYYLENSRKDTPIQVTESGYRIFLPYKEAVPVGITNQEWRKLRLEDPELLEEIYLTSKKEISSKNLLDYEDQGAKCLYYREHNKTKSNGSDLYMIHYVCIQDQAKLLASI